MQRKLFYEHSGVTILTEPACLVRTLAAVGPHCPLLHQHPRP